VLDPFCGGGSIPLEAQRLGLRAYASDLNPVPVLITKALIEIPPKFAGRPPVNPQSRGEAGPAGKKGDGKGKSVFEKLQWRGAQGLAEDVRYYGKWMRDEAEKRIGHLYPKVKVTAEMAKDRLDLKPYVGEELTVLAWIWARTVPSPDPAANGTPVPLVRSFWLSMKKGQEAYVRPEVNTEAGSYRFRVAVGRPHDEFDPSRGTVVRAGGRCILTNTPMPFDYLRAEGKAGHMSARLMAIVAQGSKGRVYIEPTPEHEAAALVGEPHDVPDTSLPDQALSIRVMLYGMDKHHKLFTKRQLVLLTTLSDLVREATKQLVEDLRASGLSEAKDYVAATSIYLGEAVSKTAAFHCTLATWRAKEGKSARAFGRQSLPMTWDFAEVSPFADAGGALDELFDSAQKTICDLPATGFGSSVQRDARTKSPVSAALVSTDPPYYDNVNYADLSDFYYGWLRRSLQSVDPSLFATVQTPKGNELIATPFRHEGSREKAAEYFRRGMLEVFDNLRAISSTDFPTTVYYGFKQSETDDGDEDEIDGANSLASTGWETMLQGVIDARFSILGTWPMRTESTVGLKNISNVLASSIILVCRGRSESAPLATRREFLGVLKHDLPIALRHLQRGNIAPVDLAQSSIGPGMAVFTRYAKVMEADGSPMKVRQALSLINQMLDEVLAEQEGEFDGDTRWALAWFEQFGTEDGPFGVAETLSKAKNTAVNGLVEAGIIAARAGKVRLLKRDELPADWNPATDTRLRHWEIVQYLIRALETGGETAAADLLRKLGGMGETARDLAYRLYSMCERKKWAQDALAYNSLVIAWPEISKLARSAPRVVTKQAEMF